MLLVNIDYIPGAQFEVLGLVEGSVVQSKDSLTDFATGLMKIAGGELKFDTELLTEARQIATQRMVEQAEQLMADAVVNIRYATSQIGVGAEIVAYGTAVKYI